MNRLGRALLILIAVVCIGVALSYPIRYRMAQESNNSDMESLSAMRQQARGTEAAPEGETPQPMASTATGEPTADGEGPADAAPQNDTQTPTEAPAPQNGAPLTAEPAPLEIEPPEEVPATQAPAAQPEAAPTAEPAPLETELPEEIPATEAPTAQPEEAPTAEPAPPEIEPPVEVPATEAPTAEPASLGTEPPEPASDPTPTPGFEDLLLDPRTPEPTRDPEPWRRIMEPTPTPGFEDLLLDPPATPEPEENPQERDVRPGTTPEPSPTPDRDVRVGALPYPMKEKIELDEAKILPELKDIYALNHDLAGWILIPDTVIDYPVVQTQNSEFYLDHDFYGESNINGQIILDANCDPYTPSYNLVISGHHMKNGSMFGKLPEYRSKSYWEKHKTLEFDTLMTRKQYVIFAAFYSADYDEDEEGFRYNADIQYRREVEHWLDEVRENQLYDTGIDVAFGDEFLSLTTCDRSRHREGRFVVVCRKVREGETFE